MIALQRASDLALQAQLATLHPNGNVSAQNRFQEMVELGEERLANELCATANIGRDGNAQVMRCALVAVDAQLEMMEHIVPLEAGAWPSPKGMWGAAATERSCDSAWTLTAESAMVLALANISDDESMATGNRIDFQLQADSAGAVSGQYVDDRVTVNFLGHRYVGFQVDNLVGVWDATRSDAVEDEDGAPHVEFGYWWTTPQAPGGQSFEMHSMRIALPRTAELELSPTTC